MSASDQNTDGETRSDRFEPPETDGRLDVTEFEDGGCLIYDRQNPDAWIAAEFAMPPEDLV